MAEKTAEQILLEMQEKIDALLKENRQLTERLTAIETLNAETVKDEVQLLNDLKENADITAEAAHEALDIAEIVESDKKSEILSQHTDVGQAHSEINKNIEQQYDFSEKAFESQNLNYCDQALFQAQQKAVISASNRFHSTIDHTKAFVQSITNNIHNKQLDKKIDKAADLTAQIEDNKKLYKANNNVISANKQMFEAKKELETQKAEKAFYEKTSRVPYKFMKNYKTLDNYLNHSNDRAARKYRKNIQKETEILEKKNKPLEKDNKALSEKLKKMQDKRNEIQSEIFKSKREETSHEKLYENNRDDRVNAYIDKKMEKVNEQAKVIESANKRRSRGGEEH